MNFRRLNNDSNKSFILLVWILVRSQVCVKPSGSGRHKTEQQHTRVVISTCIHIIEYVVQHISEVCIRVQKLEVYSPSTLHRDCQMVHSLPAGNVTV
jgi:hypothetical protein